MRLVSSRLDQASGLRPLARSASDRDDPHRTLTIARNRPLHEIGQAQCSQRNTNLHVVYVPSTPLAPVHFVDTTMQAGVD